MYMDCITDYIPTKKSCLHSDQSLSCQVDASITHSHENSTSRLVLGEITNRK